MAAALASAKNSATPNVQNQGKAPVGKNEEQIDPQNPFQVSDGSDLKILKASSVNQKYMTELINNQKITPNELNRKAEILSSDDDMDPNSNRIMSDMGVGH